MRFAALTSAVPWLTARRPRFSLRSLLTAITVVALFLGWYVPRVQIERNAAEAICTVGGKIVYHWQVRPEDCPPDYRPDPPGPNFIRAWFGPHWFDSIAIVHLSRHRMRNGKNRFELVAPHLLRLDGLRNLRLEMVEIDDAGYHILGCLPQLEALSIGLRHELTPNNAAEIAKLSNLRELRLHIAHVSPSALRELARLRNLVELDISCNGFDPQTGRAEERSMSTASETMPPRRSESLATSEN